MRSGTRWAAAIILMAMFAIGGCEREGPAERAGEEVDEAVEETGEGIEELGEGAEEQTN
ncbi:hypothetical protein [Thiohalomonas denitrificans]|uniref:Uncharacterized protein n=1 Tax=Thiohalomonas denitrificans TaxID=415747 RepID=A0A1G5Q815_9GAMM|nr:hypothetical protein [Thiohalomonas denitrificans]SCZ57758.1 hypothetical protein SAMN03097708_01502 [Thiohalomonas denitrificans]